MKITIVGAGAIGGVLGAYLSRGGLPVRLADIDAAHVRRMQEAGLTVELPDGSFTVPVEACTMEELLAAGRPLELVLLCVKGQDTTAAARAIAPLLTADGAVVSCQNGLCETQIARIVGRARTVGCFVNLFADYLSPGVVQYSGGGALYIGELDGRITRRVERIAESFAFWGPARITDNIFGCLWSKLAYGAMLTGTALTDETIADVLADRTHLELLLDVAAEPLATARRYNIEPMPFDDWNPAWAFPAEQRDWNAIDREIKVHIARLRSYTKTKSGIWRDLAVRKRKTEAPSQLSPVIALAEKAGVATPLLRALVSLIGEIEAGRRRLSLANLDELRRAGFTPARLKGLS